MDPYQVTMIGLAVGIVNKEIGNGAIPRCPHPQKCDKIRHCTRACAPLWLKAAKELRFPYAAHFPLLLSFLKIEVFGVIYTDSVGKLLGLGQWTGAHA